jgi:tellurite resistance protein TerC
MESSLGHWSLESPYGWAGFLLFVFLMLALDLGVFHRKSHAVKIREALIWSAVWIALALAFNVLVYYNLGSEKALQFFTGYVIEKALSVDNLFVFILVFGYFHVKPEYQHRILFWGVLGALVMRAIFIFLGVALIEQFNWIVIVFGVFLVYTGVHMFFQDEKPIEPDKNPLVRLFKKFFPVTNETPNGKLFTRIDGKMFATPLFIVLIVIEFTDLIFAVDSIPAILAITTDRYIVFTSNVFAILGLRSLYFALAGMMKYFTYLKYGLAVILSFVGLKMILAHFYPGLIPVEASLLIILLILTFSVLASFVWKSNVVKEEPLEE